MINRNVFRYPSVIAEFDHFNDYQDTMWWLKTLPKSERRDNAITVVETSHELYLKEKSNEPKR